MLARALVGMCAGIVCCGVPSLAAACALINAVNQPDGWAAAYDLFSSAAELLLRADCTLERCTPEFSSYLSSLPSTEEGFSELSV